MIYTSGEPHCTRSFLGIETSFDCISDNAHSRFQWSEWIVKSSYSFAGSSIRSLLTMRRIFLLTKVNDLYQPEPSYSRISYPIVLLLRIITKWFGSLKMTVSNLIHCYSDASATNMTNATNHYRRPNIYFENAKTSIMWTGCNYFVKDLLPNGVAILVAV